MSVPPQFKKLKKYIREGKKLSNRQPGPAYYTLLFAVQQAMTIDSQSTEAKIFIGNVMDDMEKIKSKPEYPDIAQEEHKVAIEELALRVFDAADEVDKRGEATKKTAQAFSTAFVLCDVLKHFGDRDEEIVTKGKYALMKTASILTALKQGKKPEAGIPEEMKAKVEEKLPEPNAVGLGLPEPNSIGMGMGMDMGLPAPNSIDYGRQDTGVNDALNIDDEEMKAVKYDTPADICIGLDDEPMAGPSAPAGNNAIDNWQPPPSAQHSSPLEELVDACAGVEETVSTVISSLRLKDLDSALATMKQFVQALTPYNKGGVWRPSPVRQSNKSEACTAMEEKMRHMVSALRFMDVYAALAILGQCIRISSQYSRSGSNMYTV